eukprot:3561341-Prymnesium_polylepis.1
MGGGGAATEDEANGASGAFGRCVSELVVEIENKMRHQECSLEWLGGQSLESYFGFQTKDEDAAVEVKTMLHFEDEARTKVAELRQQVDRVHASSRVRHVREKQADMKHKLDLKQRRLKELKDVEADVRRRESETGLFLTSLYDVDKFGVPITRDDLRGGWREDGRISSQFKLFDSYVQQREALPEVQEIRASMERLKGTQFLLTSKDSTAIAQRGTNLTAFKSQLKKFHRVENAYAASTKGRREQLEQERASLQQKHDDLLELPSAKKPKSELKEIDRMSKDPRMLPPKLYDSSGKRLPVPDPPPDPVKRVDERAFREAERIRGQLRKIDAELVSLGVTSRVEDLYGMRAVLFLPPKKEDEQFQRNVDAKRTINSNMKNALEEAVQKHPTVLNFKSRAPSDQQLVALQKAVDPSAAKAELEAAEQLVLSGVPPPELTQTEECARVLAAVGPFDVLDVPRDADADHVEKRFRELSLLTHPDKGGSEDAFKKLDPAKKTLLDSEKRQEYVKTHPLRVLRTELSGPLLDSDVELAEMRRTRLEFVLQVLLVPLFDQLPARGAETNCTPTQRKALTPEMKLARVLDDVFCRGHLSVADPLLLDDAGDLDKTTRVATSTGCVEIQGGRLEVEMPFEILTLKEHWKLIMPKMAKAVSNCKRVRALQDILNDALCQKMQMKKQQVPRHIQMGVEALRGGSKRGNEKAKLEAELADAQRKWLEPEARKTQFGKSFPGWMRLVNKANGDEDEDADADAPMSTVEEQEEYLRLMG